MDWGGRGELEGLGADLEGFWKVFGGPIWRVLGPLAREGDNGPQAPVAVLSGRGVAGLEQLAIVKFVCEFALPGTQCLRAIFSVDPRVFLAQAELRASLVGNRARKLGS